MAQVVLLSIIATMAVGARSIQATYHVDFANEAGFSAWQSHILTTIFSGQLSEGNAMKEYLLTIYHGDDSQIV